MRYLMAISNRGFIGKIVENVDLSNCKKTRQYAKHHQATYAFHFWDFPF